jgi:L-asparagine transporter-like permease
VYALRMVAIFQLSQASLWLRTRVMPRWMALITIVLALVLLFVFTQSWWVVLVFPAWVLLVSIYILAAQPGERSGADVDGQGQAGSAP